MMNLHGRAREIAIDDILNKEFLLDRAGREWGLEDESTIELYVMKERGESYVTMFKYYEMVNEALENEMFGFAM